MADVIRDDGRYPVDAFAFLHEGLGRAVRDVHGGDPEHSERRHVSGQQLCESLRALASERWGLLAPAVLAHWNVRGTIDYGNMVYLLIRHGMMKKTDEDSLEDFRDVYDFAKAFDKVQFELKE